MDAALIVVLALSLLTYLAVKGISAAQKKSDEKKEKAEEQERLDRGPLGVFCNQRVTTNQVRKEIEDEYFELSYTDLNDYDEFAPLPKSNDGLDFDILDKELVKDQDFSEKAQNQINSCIVDDNGELVSPLDLVKVKADQPSTKVVEENRK